MASVGNVSATPAVRKPTRPIKAPRMARCSVARTEAVQTETVSELDISKKENLRLKNELIRIKRTATELEKERDFYFQKLQQMDILFHNQEELNSEEFIQRIQGILYDEKPDVSSKSLVAHISPCSSPVMPLPTILSGQNKENANVSNSPLF